MKKQEFIDQLRYILDNNMVPFIDVQEAYNISPKAIRNFKATETGIEFKADFQGVGMSVKIDYKYILRLRAESKEEHKKSIPGTWTLEKDDEVKINEEGAIMHDKNTENILLPKQFIIAQKFLENIIKKN